LLKLIEQAQTIQVAAQLEHPVKLWRGAWTFKNSFALLGLNEAKSAFTPQSNAKLNNITQIPARSGRVTRAIVC
jgi:hypothetical protein